MILKNYLLKYTGINFLDHFNLGDDIQTLAVSNLMPTIDGYASREELNKVKEKCIVPMCGYFLKTENWPPSSAIKPVFYSFHLNPKSESTILNKRGIEYLKKWQPIGCRDKGTSEILKKNGIEAYYTKCVTLTFPLRKVIPKNGRIYIVGVKKSIYKAIPKTIATEAIIFDQSNVRLPLSDPKVKSVMAASLIEEYKTNAKLVITSKLHCALPCIAMGIPVVFLYPSSNKRNYRVHIIKELIGINYISDTFFSRLMPSKLKSNKINWNPDIVDIEELKVKIKEGFKQKYEEVKNSIS
ncbi:MAG: hypothetical protein ACI8PW_001443 [Methylophilaceae bacterium]|jgi:hypothetical protein